MVITVNLNPAMDKTITLNGLNVGSVNRVESLRYDIGGKGINVSKVLKNFRVESICTGFLGGIWERSFVEELNKRGISNKFISIEGDTRTNTKIVDVLNNTHTDINEPGPEVDSKKMQKFIDEFKILCKKNDIVVLSGGVSPSIPKDIYYKLTIIAKEKGAIVVMDADGELLMEGVKAKPHIIKPNNHELKKLLNIDDTNENEIIGAGQYLLQQGIEKVMISLGDKGAIYITKNGIYKSNSLKVNVKSTVGAGDSMVSAMVYAHIKNYDDADTLRFATACGAATVSLEGTEACTLEQVNELLNDVRIEKKECL
ncbi:1-phosphofructokinase [Clostridium sp. JN-9]|uniref:1-phosphofructokinase n=1 Tax=Clostridium sp. JN-9 TaxID=2507159 RepID=UPI000FFE2C29|nr:1-phosphofructokinase [Clostridium sp. JN-9]QAT41347.1 1-phosphofructokinase [Clostridium sp. JN-9]